jgi:uncharacterized membrane protein
MEARNKRSTNQMGVILIVIAATLSSLGQLAWKLGADAVDWSAWLFYLLGFLAAAAGMFVMMAAFRYGQVSILQPMMSLGFALSIFLGAFFLGEPITLLKVVGTLCIIVGSVLLGIEGNEESL